MDITLLLVLGVVALLYASVGHGGASGYLALMSMSGMATSEIRPTALMLNLLVAGIAFYQFHRNGHFKWSRTWPFVIGSVPAAFIGGMIELPTAAFKMILGVFLLLAVVRMLIPIKASSEFLDFNLYLGVLVGAAIGLFSGMIGIGGGIVLSPVILLLGWADVKSTAATSALFIWVNSLAGLSGYMAMDHSLTFQYYPIFIIAGIAAIVGGFFGSFHWNHKVVKYVLSFVLLIAAVKLIFVL